MSDLVTAPPAAAAACSGHSQHTWGVPWGGNGAEVPIPARDQSVCSEIQNDSWKMSLGVTVVVCPGGSLQTAHLRPQLRVRPCDQGGPGDPGHLHPQPPHQEHQRRQLVPDHHSTEPGQPQIRCVCSQLLGWARAAPLSGEWTPPSWACSRSFGFRSQQ